MTDSFGIIAEFSIGLAGFSGVAALPINSFIVTDYAAAILLGGLIHQLLSGAVAFSNDLKQGHPSKSDNKTRAKRGRPPIRGGCLLSVSH